MLRGGKPDNYVDINKNAHFLVLILFDANSMCCNVQFFFFKCLKSLYRNQECYYLFFSFTPQLACVLLLANIPRVRSHPDSAFAANTVTLMVSRSPKRLLGPRVLVPLETWQQMRSMTGSQR
jgi:hypothetical protein